MIATASKHLFPELTYANDAHGPFQRLLIQRIEALAGRDRIARLYEIWQRDVAPTGHNLFTTMLQMVGMDLRIAGQWPPRDLPDTPVLMVANHPFGIADGIAILAMAERLGRPFRVLIHKDLLRIGEMTPYALPIDFGQSREAVVNNMAVRQQALDLLRAGVTLVVFPAGGVATAPRIFDKALDLDWKMFPARLVKDAQASVLPIYFHGQNSWMFHVASHLSMTLRLALLVPEFLRRAGKPIEAHAGQIVHAGEFSGDRSAVLERMRRAVFELEHTSLDRARQADQDTLSAPHHATA